MIIKLCNKIKGIGSAGVILDKLVAKTAWLAKRMHRQFKSSLAFISSFCGGGMGAIKMLILRDE
jgi:hypothetical protein